MDNLMSATLVYDYIAGPQIPERLLPEDIQKIQAAGQFVGTHAEQLSEIAGRVCYDSFGKGRDSAGYHAHILEVKHGSVIEHFNFTAAFYNIAELNLLEALINRPGIWVDHHRVTVNLRALVEWYHWHDEIGDSDYIGAALRQIGHALAPNIIVLNEIDEKYKEGAINVDARIEEPETSDEKWITMLLTGSRGFSHELVRHGDWTAISQRSTRYVDEDGSDYVYHPLINKYLKDERNSKISGIVAQLKHSRQADGDTYRLLVGALQPWLVEQGADKFTARKQARGAARGFLGNALYTEVIFSANVRQWHRMLRQRCCQAADAEIRQVFAQVLELLQICNYKDEFANWKLEPSSDGIGFAGVEE